MNLKELSAEYIKKIDKGHVNRVYMDRRKRVCGAVVRTAGRLGLGTRSVDTLQADHYARILENIHSDYRQESLSALNSMTRIARKHGIPTIVPGEAIGIKSSAASDPGICPAEGVDCFLNHIHWKHPEFWGNAYLIVGLGVRISESAGAYQIDNSICIPASAAKTATRRIIEIPAWMGPLPEDPDPRFGETRNGKPAPIYTRWQAARSECELPSDISLFRHTVASHLLNVYKDDARVALMMGHSRQVLHARYKALTPAAESAEWVKVIAKHFGGT